MDILHSLHTLVQLIYETLASLYYSLLLIGAIGIAAQGVFGFMHGGGSHAGHAPRGRTRRRRTWRASCGRRAAGKPPHPHRAPHAGRSPRRGRHKHGCPVVVSRSRPQRNAHRAAHGSSGRGETRADRTGNVAALVVAVADDNFFRLFGNGRGGPASCRAFGQAADGPCRAFVRGRFLRLHHQTDDARGFGVRLQTRR